MYATVGKRALDLAGSLITLAILWPVLAMTALVIWVYDGRPVLYRQRRPGLHGKPFEILKFRTMRMPAEQRVDQERVTALGRCLRAVSLDELPELLNVLTGDMSLVGPRPLLPESTLTDIRQSRLAAIVSSQESPVGPRLAAGIRSPGNASSNSTSGTSTIFPCGSI